MGEIVEDVPLPLLFQRAQALHTRSASSQLDPDELNKGIRLLLQCQEMVDKLAIFSSNEKKEDVSTSDLKYLLVEYYLGELTERTPATERIDVVRAAINHLKTFVRSCELLDLVPEGELVASTRDTPVDPATRRAEKITRFKRQRAAESKLQEINERKERRRRSMQAAGKQVVDYGEEDIPDGDDEEEREAWFVQLSLAVCKAVDLLEMLQREETMLLAVRKENENGGEFAQAVLDERHAKAEAWHRESATKSKVLRPAQPITCATFAQDVIEGRANISDGHQHSHQPLFGPASLVGSSITTERERLAAQVFQPSHSLPSMSIEQAGLKEMEMMRKWQERNQQLQQESKSTWLEEESKDGSDDEAAESKQRAWDDWKDENPRGSGNKKLTPCG
ncbi:PP2A regulatory subunit TAP46 [Selaginella moellendorffii]|uniref:PP2A regulatory subunit TAP46 n=1 Tax=Selaginella moellendorffii TaxID=88036 RepID=UPI000D1CB8F6|nr:PP2A regulatory subunit TAP46 [Selaginella moellendorffii]|eukprot:XP_024519574.1 PP2A regulatory subunit TAP46 [Selaginella moellendorffii]